ncbi:MAG TPA: PKD domain-containing protein [Ohtaekwangia sp.]
MNLLFKTVNPVRLYLVLAFVAATLGIQAQGLVPDNEEREALLALYHATEGDSTWIDKWTLSRINSFPDSTLHGVFAPNGDIISINLSGNNLVGTLPEQLNKLRALVTLSLGANRLSGTIPVLDSLTKLRTLNLSGHRFTGVIPTWLNKLQLLEDVNLSAATGSYSMSGPIPPSISQLTHLSKLSLSNNDLGGEGDIPAEFSDLNNLRELYLDRCNLQLASVTTGLSGLPSLTILDLSRNPQFKDAAGVLPDCLLDLPLLYTLYLRENGINAFPESFSDLPKLNELDLSGTNYSNDERLSSTIDELKSIPSLKILKLVDCEIIGLPDDFDSLTVETLHLSSNDDLEPEQCNDLGNMPMLKTLWIDQCDLTALPSNLSNSNSLRQLWAASNHLQPLSEEIRDLPNLETLDLTSNGITSLPSWFGTGTMISLKTLVLNNNQLVTLPDNFVKLANLEILRISINDLNGKWPANFDSLTSIRELHLYDNHIDSLPNLTKLRALEKIDLHKNELRDTVPAFLSNVTSLKKYVDISFNYYSVVDSACHFNESTPTVKVNNNQFTFEDVLEFKPASGSYVYSPQPMVDTVREIYSFPGSFFELTAVVDTALWKKARFQWFKVHNGSHQAISPATDSAFHYIVANTLETDEGAQFYYRITHPDAPNLVLTSQRQTLVFSCEHLITGAGFNAKRYLCAMNFIPAVKYKTNCNTATYAWDFGDGATSVENSPWHAFPSEGTYTVSMTVSYSCGPCAADSTIVKQVTFTLPNEFVTDSLVQIQTDVREGILAVGATTFSDAWPLQHPLQTANVNSYLNGSQGVWRNDGGYVYDVPRSKSAQTNIAKDGTFTLEQFNWSSAELDAIPDWTKANTITQYSPYSYELENQDVLGIHSAALYDYGGHLPSANGVNMRNNEMAFTSFEFLDQNATGNLIFGNQPLPEYYIYKVRSARNHIAVVEASVEQLANVEKVDVRARSLFALSPRHGRHNNYIQDDPVLCIQNHPTVPSWSMIVLRREPFPGLWKGEIKVKNDLQPIITPVIDNTLAHSGKNSLKISSEMTFKQNLLRLDSGKTYFLNAWVSVNNPYVTTPKLADNLGIEITFRDENEIVLATRTIQPSGPVIEGWQQVRGNVVCPAKLATVELKFKPGSTGNAWYDDLRIHPEKGNMKSYVYNIEDYRLQAILDEENFATFYYYDDEGNLFLVKKETERGIKTISENVSSQVKSEIE